MIETFAETLREMSDCFSNIVDLMLHKSSKLEKEKLKGKIELIVSYQWKIMMSNPINLTLVTGAKLGNIYGVGSL